MGNSVERVTAYAVCCARRLEASIPYKVDRAISGVANPVNAIAAFIHAAEDYEGRRLLGSVTFDGDATTTALAGPDSRICGPAPSTAVVDRTGSTMNTARIIAALTLTLTTFSSVANAVNGAPTPAQGLTREEVIAELFRARQAGEIGTYGDSDRAFRNSAIRSEPSTLTRAQVQAELQRARSSGDLAITNELYGANVSASRATERVRAEALAGRQIGGFSRGGNQTGVPRN